MSVFSFSIGVLVTAQEAVDCPGTRVPLADKLPDVGPKGHYQADRMG